MTFEERTEINVSPDKVSGMLLRFEQVELLISKRECRTWQQAFWSTYKTIGHIHRGGRLHPIYQLSLDAAEHPSSSNALLARLSVGVKTTAFRFGSRRRGTPSSIPTSVSPSQSHPSSQAEPELSSPNCLLHPPLPAPRHVSSTLPS